MTGNFRLITKCVSLTAFIALLGFLTPILNQGAAAQDGGCPCNFDDVPKTSDCWVEGVGFETFLENGNEGCAVSNNEQPQTLLLVEQEEQGELFCTINAEREACGDGAFSTQVGLTEAEYAACKCDLEAYATALNNEDNNVTVDGDGVPPYRCLGSECAPGSIPAPLAIPTLNQWGMIIMAGFLGLVALYAIRRRLVKH